MYIGGLTVAALYWNPRLQRYAQHFGQVTSFPNHFF
jgi:hypothetical protein